jgi:hypothetical protein
MSSEGDCCGWVVKMEVEVELWGGDGASRYEVGGGGGEGGDMVSIFGTSMHFEKYEKTASKVSHAGIGYRYRLTDKLKQKVLHTAFG